MYLLDTNVLSELRKLPKGRANRGVEAWTKKVEDQTSFLSVITILEIETGILRLERHDETQAAHLRHWLVDIVLPDFDKRILDIDIATVREAARLHTPNPRPAHDTLIAATASMRRLTLITRNIADFAGTGVRVFNPWAD